MRLYPFIALLPLVLHAAELPPLPIAESVHIGTLTVSTKAPPAGITVRPVLGLLTVDALDGRVIHRTSSRILETRATITPGGDYLLMFPEGDHYAKSKGEKMNTMLAYRSSDKGKSWNGPKVAYDIPYSQHGFIPFIPRNSKRIYAFGTQPIPGKWSWEEGKRENAPIGFRWSDDDGHTWSDVKLIEPMNDPGFQGMSVMRMTETASGAWLIGSHTADWSAKPFTTRQYLMRSEDRGNTWTLMPGTRPNGWFAEGFDRMDEGRPLFLDGARVLFMSRTPQGHLFTAWSEDDGKSWTKPAPSTLVHPDAPPMLFKLSDNKTLIAFHHHKVPSKGNGDISDKAENMRVRSEIWCAISTDEGHTWGEPRFVFANAVEANLKVSAFNSQCSYLDMFEQDGTLHLFLPHRWQQVLHLTINESALASLPTEPQLRAMVETPAAKAKTSAFRIEPGVILTGAGDLIWAQSRAAVVPGKPSRVILTTQQTEKVGAHGYHDVFMAETKDEGRTWSETQSIPSLQRKRMPEGHDFVMGDISPQWHAATGTVLATGKTFGFAKGLTEDRKFERVSYAIFTPDTNQWSSLKLLDLPENDHAGNRIIEPNAGCTQRFDLPNGDILLPIRYRANPKNRQYTTIVARCSFDGKTLTYRKHDSELTAEAGRGLYEPSVTCFQGRYYLTLRGDQSGFVARSQDGLHYEPVEWKYDDGKLLGSVNTQQHWVTHSDGLYLAYTRKGANNDHVFRNRAPLFIAKVDPERLCVLRETEQVLMPENGLDLGAGFGVTDVSPTETWVISSEMVFPKDRLKEPNHVRLARIIWASPNKLFAAFKP